MVDATVGVTVIGSEGLLVLHYSSAELRQLRSTNEHRHVVVNDAARHADQLGLRNTCRRGRRSGRRLCGWPRLQGRNVTTHQPVVSRVGCWQSASQKFIHDSAQQLGLQHSPPAPLQLPQHIPVIVSDPNGVRGRR